MNQSKFILASGSPRRIEMMQARGISPIIMKPDVDEALPEDISMEQAVMYLALKKALHVERECQDGWIIAADTVVYKERIIGKPQDPADAKKILQELRNGQHYVATGVAVVNAKTCGRRVFCEVTRVFFKDYSDEEIEGYIATEEPWDKAGGYAIQGGFAPHIQRIEGDYDNVVGFPWRRIEKELAHLGCPFKGDSQE